MPLRFRVSNVFYQAGEHRAEKVADLFAAIAPRYDLLNDLQSLGLHRLWKRRVAALAGAAVGKRALDLCCGTGDIAFALAQRGAEVIGLDFSPKMIQVARARNRRFKLLPGMDRAPDFIAGDAQAIPFPDESFDIVTVGYGLRNLAGWERGLREMARVARPGARLVTLDFGKPPNPLWRRLYFLHLKCSVPAMGWLFCRQPQAYAYILESLRHFPEQSVVAEKMRAMNLANVRHINLLGGAMAIHYGEKARASAPNATS
ncbi:MAG: ubiquinone/menaquinone biosynthesis methyltransferase [Verrucomicrobia bacterium]|nr:ubiquinone/menaquinone biosynthesis methyltransferase [Verrucomicrobiota bacterium]MDE3098277.1 ubiquinone/menaquinone biosynthesis methyltransferase [Verrucomicrobiota bacterium]